MEIYLSIVSGFEAWNYAQIYLHHSDFSSLFRTLICVNFSPSLYRINFHIPRKCFLQTDMTSRTQSNEENHCAEDVFQQCFGLYAQIYVQHSAFSLLLPALTSLCRRRIFNLKYTHRISLIWFHLSIRPTSCHIDLVLHS